MNATSLHHGMIKVTGVPFGWQISGSKRPILFIVIFILPLRSPDILLISKAQPFSPHDLSKCSQDKIISIAYSMQCKATGLSFSVPLKQFSAVRFTYLNKSAVDLLLPTWPTAVFTPNHCHLLHGQCFCLLPGTWVTICAPALLLLTSHFSVTSVFLFESRIFYWLSAFPSYLEHWYLTPTKTTNTWSKQEMSYRWWARTHYLVCESHSDKPLGNKTQQQPGQIDLPFPASEGDWKCLGNSVEWDLLPHTGRKLQNKKKRVF